MRKKKHRYEWIGAQEVSLGRASADNHIGKAYTLLSCSLRRDEAGQELRKSSVLIIGFERAILYGCAAAISKTIVRSQDEKTENSALKQREPLAEGITFRMMEYMRDLLLNAMVIHSGHRPGLERFHDREITLVREKRDGPTTTQEHHWSPLELVARAMQRLRLGRPD